MIYFLRHVETGLIKIGVTDNLDTRTYQLNSEHGELEVLGLMQGSFELEHALHMVFAKLNVKGVLYGKEWFLPNPELMTYIDNLEPISTEPETYPVELPNSVSSIGEYRIAYRLPEVIEIAMQKYGLKQTTIARLLGVDDGIISRILKTGHKVNLVNFELIVKASHAFCLTPNDILMEAINPSQLSLFDRDPAPIDSDDTGRTRRNSKQG